MVRDYLALPVMDAYDVHSGSTALFTYVDTHRALWSRLLTGGAAGTIREEFRRLPSIERIVQLHESVVVAPVIEASRGSRRRKVKT